MEYAAYYKNCLLYLACVDIAVDLTPDERLQRARELGIASLLGETIYNFGELVSVIFSTVCCICHVDTVLSLPTQS